MHDEKIRAIREFCRNNADPAVVAKYSRYFREGYDGYGVDDKILAAQREKWLDQWQAEMSVTDYLDLGDRLVASGKFEETAMAIHFIASRKEQFSPDVFHRVGRWLEHGIANWASTDVLCMLVLVHFIRDDIVGTDELAEWTRSPSTWKRRAVPVTLAQLVKTGIQPKGVFPAIDPLMGDAAEDVQKGLGTLLRELWKRYPGEIEAYLMKWKDDCGRLIIRYATEKMAKEDRKRFRKSKA
jgi:3-methyladenine DNA glycosylase AlkD